MSETVLVTGAFGLVGSAVVGRLAADGRKVVATAHHKVAKALPDGVDVRWADLTDCAQVDRLVSDVSPGTIIHLAAVIPKLIYRNAKLARRVNVDATAALVRAAEAQPSPPLFLHASSNAVYGECNPHRTTDLARADTAPKPTDLYSGHKLEAEEFVRSSSLAWVILRLGGVLSVDPSATPLSLDMVYFTNLIPTDGRVHTVDVRDVASAFAAATTADVAGEILLIGGDESHLLTQRDIGPAIVAARGLAGMLPAGRPGNPHSDDDWFLTNWIHTERAQQALSFQHHTWPDMLAEIRSQAGWKRYPTRLVVPIPRAFMNRQAAYRNTPGQYADPWGALRARFGEPGLD
jgi:nucleoside-diphosphate-sugar epimerase